LNLADNFRAIMSTNLARDEGQVFAQVFDVLAAHALKLLKKRWILQLRKASESITLSNRHLTAMTIIK